MLAVAPVIAEFSSQETPHSRRGGSQTCQAESRLSYLAAGATAFCWRDKMHWKVRGIILKDLHTTLSPDDHGPDYWLPRSVEIPEFISHVGQLSDEHLGFIWDAARQSAHESIRHAVLNLLEGIFPGLSKEQVCCDIPLWGPSPLCCGKVLLYMQYEADAALPTAVRLMSDYTETSTLWVCRECVRLVT